MYMPAAIDPALAAVCELRAGLLPNTNFYMSNDT